MALGARIPDCELLSVRSASAGSLVRLSMGLAETVARARRRKIKLWLGKGELQRKPSKTKLDRSRKQRSQPPSSRNASVILGPGLELCWVWEMKCGSDC